MQIERYEEELKKINKLNEYAALLTEYNKKFNLTSITEEEEIFYKHFLDSVLGEGYFNKNDNVVEIGSGAGFPSIPLKLYRQDLKFTLIESTQKKCSFLSLAVRELQLENMKVLNARAEEAAQSEEYREQFNSCCARAVAPLNTLAEYMLPFLKIGGRMVAYKGNAEEEIKAAQKAISVLGGRVEEVCCYSLPHGFGERTLVVIKKEKSTPKKYPRGHGKERSNPL